MATNYDELGEQYLLTKSLPWKRFTERYTFFKAVGPVKGLRLIDVACGDGFYSRQFRDAGADVVGVDVSEAMIRLAKEHEAREPKGIRYEVGDATDLQGMVDRTGLDGFDLAVAEWLLDYADTRAMLRGMCRSLTRVLRPGGRFVHLGGCFDSLIHHPENFPRYGIDLEVLRSCGDGSRCRFSARSPTCCSVRSTSGDGGSRGCARCWSRCRRWPRPHPAARRTSRLPFPPAGPRPFGSGNRSAGLLRSGATPDGCSRIRTRRSTPWSPTSTAPRRTSTCSSTSGYPIGTD